MDWKDVLTLVLGGFTLASLLGTIAASFYGVRQKTIIATLKESNDAYKERNAQLEDQVNTLQKSITDMQNQHTREISELRGRVEVLTNMKTPSLEPMMTQLSNNHKEVMAALGHPIKEGGAA